MQGGRNLIKRLVTRIARPLTDDRGAVLVYVSLALTVFMGMAALAIDASRLFTLQTEMQSAADAFALAAAAELDGNAGAQTRAQAAIANMVQNNQTFATGANAIVPGDLSVTFYSSIPSDDQPLSAGTIATDDATTRFVRVKVNQRQTSNIFAEFIGGGATATATAQAVAGFTQAVCKFTPLFICNPYADKDALLSALESGADQSRLIDLKKWSGSGKISAGNFGFLEPADGRGANALKQSLGKVDPGTCFQQSGVNLEQGNIASVRDAVNTRFDLYERSYSSKKNDPLYGPAQNVIKGYTYSGNAACNSSLDTTNAYAMPLDDCFATASCDPLGTGTEAQPNRWGLGVWNFNKYWDMNHGNRNGVYTDDGVKPVLSPLSRYKLYLWEIQNGIPNKSPGGENGNPKCSTPAIVSPDRRILYAAVLQCPIANGNSGGPNADGSYPVLAFVKMFITRPMSKNNTTCQPNDDTCESDSGDLYVEMIDVVKPGADDAVLHDMVQLYK
jgi:Flp pilus assembly protein TadG